MDFNKREKERKMGGRGGVERERRKPTQLTKVLRMALIGKTLYFWK